jgi:transposase
MVVEAKRALITEVGQRYSMVSPYLSECAKRIWAASEALSIGWGGHSIVCEATGISRVTITKGKKELQGGVSQETNCLRVKGGGRKRLVKHAPELLKDLEALIDPCTRGDPQSPLRWTCKSTYKLSEALTEQGHQVCQRTVYRLLQERGYSLQSNRKVEEGKQHADHDAQFHYINGLVKRFQQRNQPVISVDAKKKENIGHYRNLGEEWEKEGKPTLVNT